MQFTKIQSPISLADTVIRRYSATEDRLALELQAWNNSLVHLNFSGVIGLGDFGGREIRGFVQSNGSSEILRIALQRTFGRVPESHEYHLFQGLDHDGQAAIEVIAKAVAVTI
ncbi:MAG TPA: hypothetical protein VFW23_13625 [Tepidisphaeraceae bacterium]|nr:hypothetical protein [Tepidisphaeraceae bacterium]